MLKIDKKIIAIVVAVLLIAGATWYLFGNVSDNSGRIDAIGSELDAAADAQQSAIDRLGNIENGLDSSATETGRISDSVGESAKSVAGVENRIQQSQGRLGTSAEIIADCQRILAEVRARGQVGEK